MAQPPKKDLIYDTKKLSVLFGLTSIALLLVIVFLVVDDHSREWKRYQRSFNQLELAKTEDELKQVAKKVNSAEMEKLRKELAEINQSLAAMKKELAGKIKKRSELSVRLYKINQELQVQKSHFESVRYAYEEHLTSSNEHLIQMKGSHEAETKKLKKEMGEWEARVNQSQNALDEITREKEKVDAEAADFTKDRDALQTKLKEMSQAEERLKKKLAALQPGFFNTFRNSPIFDFMAPSLKIRQIVMEDLYDDYNFVRVPKVDRCTTCHLAIDQKGFENAPQPFRTHPNLDLFVGSNSHHAMETFACTVCHGGNGQAITFYHTGHTPGSEDQAHEWEKKYHWHPVKHWAQPMLPLKDVEASCIKCHRNVLEVPQAPKVNEGRRLFEELGCWGCHKVEGIEGLRPVGPDLTHLRGKVDPAWAHQWIKDPKSFRPDTKMPGFFGLSNAVSPEEEEVEVNAIVSYLYANSEEIKPEEVKGTGDAAKGKELVNQIGCLACHSLGETKVSDFAPNLSAIGSKVSLPWLVDWLKNPKHYFPETKMPSLRLTDQEAVDIASYLMTLKNPKFDALSEPEINQEVLDRLVIEELRENLTEKEAGQKLSTMKKEEKEVFLGERLIAFHGCFACHTIKGFEEAKQIGTELTEEGSKLVEQLDFGFLDIPHTRAAFFDQKLQNPRDFDQGRVRKRKEKLHMPQFNLTEEKRAALITYLQGLTREYIPLSKTRLPDERAKQVEAGQRLIRDHNCQGCHLMEEGVGGDATKLVEDAGLAPPSIVGEGKRVQGKWLFDFLKNPSVIRPWLHFRMPTFGFSDEETDVLVKHFQAKDHVSESFADTRAKPGPETLEPGQKLFEMFQCLKCHTLAAPGAAVEGAAPLSAAQLAPDLTLARDRLRHEWIIDWLKDPNALMPGTQMPGYFPDMQSPAPDILDGDAMKQIVALRDYVVHLADEKDAKQPAAK